MSIGCSSSTLFTLNKINLVKSQKNSAWEKWKWLCQRPVQQKRRTKKRYQQWWYQLKISAMMKGYQQTSSPASLQSSSRSKLSALTSFAALFRLLSMWNITIGKGSWLQIPRLCLSFYLPPNISDRFFNWAHWSGCWGPNQTQPFSCQLRSSVKDRETCSWETGSTICWQSEDCPRTCNMLLSKWSESCTLLEGYLRPSHKENISEYDNKELWPCQKDMAIMMMMLLIKFCDLPTRRASSALLLATSISSNVFVIWGIRPLLYEFFHRLFYYMWIQGKSYISPT